MKVGLIGFLHETNTYVDSAATYQDFVEADAWPGLLRGKELFAAVCGKNLPITGFIDVASEGNELVPLLWASCSPCGPVCEEAYEKIVDEILALLEQQGPFDALYLDLHGAMVANHVEDGEGELLERIRRCVGDEIPMVASLDFHANISSKMVQHTSELFVYRTYPHIDMHTTGQRAARALLQNENTRKRAVRFQKYHSPVAMTDQCTEQAPLKEIMRQLKQIEEMAHDCHVEFAPGFPLADVPECGPSLVIYADNQANADMVFNKVAGRIENYVNQPIGKLYTIEEALAHCRGNEASKPYILADVQDNPGCGGVGDTTGILHALSCEQYLECLVGVIFDPEAANKAASAGVGHAIKLSVGGHDAASPFPPLKGRFLVEATSSGEFVGTGPFYDGCEFQLGPMAVLRQGELKIVVSSKAQQAADREMFRHLGIELEEHDIIVLKSAVHFRADFEEMAEKVLLVKSAGAAPCDPADLNYFRAFK